jgi:hypothetical protein
VQTSVNLCKKCSKTHIRASLVPKNFLGSLSLAIRGEGRTGKGEGRGGEGRGREGKISSYFRQ